MQSAVITAIIVAIVTLMCQKSLNNIISGLFIILSRPFKKGEKVSVQEKGTEIASGRVMSVGVLHTKIKTYNRDVIIIPNTQLIDNYTVVNSDYKDGMNYIQNVNVSLDTNVPKLKEIIVKAVVECEDTQNTVENTDVICRISGSYATITYNVRSSDADQSFLACSNVSEEIIKNCLHQDDIKIVTPYPFR